MLDISISQRKSYFGIAWLIANSVGFGLAWPLGEWVGQQAAGILSWGIGQITGLVVFEVILWSARALVLSRTQAYEALKPLEILIWFGTEIMGWVVGEATMNKDFISPVTIGAVFASILGALGWLVVWFIKVPKKKNKFWAIEAFFGTLFALLGGSVLFGSIMALSLVVAETIAKTNLPLAGMAVAGILLGVLIGTVTALALIQVIPWRTSEQQKSWV